MVHDFLAAAVDVVDHWPVHHLGLAVEDGEQVVLDEVEEVHVDLARVQLLLQLGVSLPVFSIEYLETDCNLIREASIGLHDKHQG